uniref:Neuromedin U C-terminal domain-containing protein n=1 Tax=Amphiprion ocellaris TaxID=80972 RepID=A0AAQ5XBK3_AMPOC
HEPSYLSDVRAELSEEPQVQKKKRRGKKKTKKQNRDEQKGQSERDEQRPEPQRSLQQPAEPQQQQHESAQRRQHLHPDRPAAPHRAPLSQCSSKSPASHNRSEAANQPDRRCVFVLPLRRPEVMALLSSFQASDILGELCVLMLVQKSKELKVQENSKRTPRLHPLLRLISQLHTRRERELTMHAELQGPGGIQSRGYFLYRPRNGRRSLEYE